MRPHWLREAEYRDRPERWRQAREEVARAGLCGALIVASPLAFITFVPGGAAPISGTAALPASLGLISVKWPLKLRALAVTSVLAMWAWNDRRLGAAYQRYMHEPRSESRYSESPPAGLVPTSSAVLSP